MHLPFEIGLTLYIIFYETNLPPPKKASLVKGNVIAVIPT